MSLPSDPDIAWIEPGFAIGSRPYAADRVRIRDQGIQVVVCVHEPSQWEVEDWQGLGVEVIAIHTPDWAPIHARNFDRVVEAVSACLDAGRPVLLHCLAGVNRAPTFAAAVLCQLRGLSVEAALQAVRSARPAAAPTPEQQQSLRAWLQMRRAQCEQ